MHRFLLGLILLGGPATAGGLELPAAADRRLTVELFAAEPDLVTPTGIAVDAKGRVLVVESHTHFRPDDYQGPPADRIRIFEDTDGDGRADRIGTFFEGSRFTMNLAVYHDGTVYVATRDEIFWLRDNDGDGKADQRTTIARLDTRGDYPHNGLSGFAFDFAGNVYFGLGENLGAKYRLVGSDGTQLVGGGEGGSIYRMAADGSGLVRVATGFWNPFHVALDAYDRLFAVDNDPDSRPPCRLLHIVPDGDYGYRFRNGRKGLHPFTAWDGELPGTLPMVAGTGEAPSGVVAYESAGLPGDYRGNLLCTSWGDHRLERYRLVPRGASFQAAAEPFVTGGEDFRPVGIAVAPDGSLFVSDWVDKSYTLHGKGRIWKVRSAAPGPARRPQEPGEAVRSADRQLGERAARQLMAQGKSGKEILREVAAEPDQPAIQARAISALAAIGDHRWLAERLASLEPATPDDPAAPDQSAMAALLVRLLDREHLDLNALAAPASPPAVRAEALRRIAGRSSVHLVRQGLADDDPFIRQAALAGLRQSAGLADLLDHAASEDKAVRLGALLLLRQSDDDQARATVSRFLEDADPDILFSAVQWVGEGRLNEHRALVESLLARAATRQLFEACLATLELLDRPKDSLAAEEEVAGEEYVARLFADSALPIDLRRRALRMLRPDHPVLTLALLEDFLQSDDLATQLEAVRTLRGSPLAEAPQRLQAIGCDPRRDAALRAEAVVGLSPNNPSHRTALLELLKADDRLLVEQALRSLWGTELDERQRVAVRQAGRLGDEAAALAARILEPDKRDSRPDQTDLAGWLELLDGPADPRAGERIFFQSELAGCHRCHQVEGRGGRIGPDLTAVGRQLQRKRLVESIIQPSKEIAPQFVTWSITRTDGTVAVGMLVGKTADGRESYADAEGRIFVVGSSELDQRHPQPLSIMPDNVARALTPREFRDLLAYLLEAR